MKTYNPESKETDYRNSVFLGGSTKEDWKGEFKKHLQALCPSCNITDPVFGGYAKANRDQTTAWELNAMCFSHVIVFWIEADSQHPCLCTFAEMGLFADSGKVIVGLPAPHDYAESFCRIHGIPVVHDAPSLAKAVSLRFSAMPTSFFTSDTHFGIEHTMLKSHRPFRDTIEMDRYMVSRWNAAVTMNDTVYHLGDFGKPGIVGKLNFRKMYFIKGNHEKTGKTAELTLISRQNLQRLAKDPRVEVCDYKDVYDTVMGVVFRLVHEPVGNPQGKLPPARMFYLYGHIHKMAFCKRNGMNVGVDCNNFSPVSLNDLRRQVKQIMEHSGDDFMFTDACSN